MVSDNATLNMMDSKVTKKISFFISDQTKVYIGNCLLDSSEIWAYDFSEVYLDNAMIDEVLYAWKLDYSSIQHYGYGSWILFENNSATISHAKIEESIRFYETSTGSHFIIKQRDINGMLQKPIQIYMN